MKLLLYITGSALLFSLHSNAQPYKTDKVFPDRYNLDIPENFKSPKFIEAVTDLLPRTLDVLRDRQFCTGCKGAYNVQLIVSKPFVRDKQYFENTSYAGDNFKSFTYSFNYYFSAVLAVKDSFDVPVYNIVLISPETELYFNRQFVLPVTYDYYNKVYDSRGRLRSVDKVARPVDAAGYIDKNVQKFSLTDKDITEIVKERLYEMLHDLKKRH